MPGNDQSFDVDSYLRYIFGEENEPEQVGEQELNRPVQAPWPIGSDTGVTVLGSTIDILQRRCDEQFAIHRAKDPELLGVGEHSNFKKIPTHTQDHGDA